MTAKKTEAAYKLWRDGRKLLPITSQANFAKSLKMMEEAIGLDDEFGRAYSRKSYLYVTGVIDGWNFEPGKTDEWKLREALTLAKKAVKLAPNDYDTHWALAFAHLNREDGKQDATREYKEALVRNDGNRNLLAEMADALVYAGKTDDAIEMLMRARRIPDWHRWVLAWAYYFKGKKDKQYYGLARDELHKMVTPRDDPRFSSEIMLLSAALYVRTNKLARAKEEIQWLQQRRKKVGLTPWTIEKERKRGSAIGKMNETHWLGALSDAGLP
ncbi:MAG: hypothetical protein O7I42_16165 [Alphaproteobacteria bacterium]|nr:hypothetical protein [Alphaproteobacteria bacterium]